MGGLLLDQTQNDVTSSTEKFLSDGLQFESLHDDKIHIYTFLDTTRASWEAWYETVLGIVDANPDGVYRVLQDYTHHRNAFTPAARGTLVRLSKNHSQIKGYMAVVLQGTIFSPIAKYFINKEASRLFPNQEARIFYTRDDALAWLESTLTD